MCVGKNGQLLEWLLSEYAGRASLAKGVHSVPGLEGEEDSGLRDFVLLAAARRFIADRSSFSYWAGLFSAGDEIHVNINYDGVHSDPATRKKYVYHDNRKDMYFGRYSHTDKNVRSAGNISSVHKQIVFSLYAPSKTTAREEWTEQHQ